MSLPTVLSDLYETLKSNYTSNVDSVAFPDKKVTADGLSWILKNVFKIGRNKISIKSASVTENVTDGTVELTGNFELFGSVDFDLTFTFSSSDEKAIDTAMTAAYPSANGTQGTLKLADLTSKLGIKVPVVPHLTISALNISASPESLSIDDIMFGNDWKINVGANSLDVGSLDLSLGYASGNGFTGSLTGTVTIDRQPFDVTYELPSNDFSVGGTIASMGLEGLVNDFISSSFQLPSGFPDLTLKNANFSIGKADEDYHFSVDVGDLNGWGEFELEIQEANHEWGFIGGFALQHDWNLSHISSIFNPIKDLDFENLGLVFSTIESSDFAFTNPKYDVPLPPDGLIEGANFFGDLQFPNNTKSAVGALGKLIGLKGQSIYLDATFPESGLSGTKITASIGDTFYIPPSTSKSKHALTLDSPAIFITAEPSFGISGTMNIPVNDQTLSIAGDLHVSVDDIGFDAYADTSSLSKPVGFNGVNLEGIGVSMGLEIETFDLDFGLEGKFELGSNPSSDLFAFKFGVGATIFNPVYLDATFEHLFLSDIFSAVMASHHSLPSALHEISFANLLIYWADEPSTLPDGTAISPGFQFNASPATFFGFQADANITMDFDSGFSGLLKVPKPIKAGSVLQVTDATHKNKGPHLSFSTISSPYLSASIDVQLFKMANSSIQATIDSGGMSFSMKNSVRGFLDDELDITVSTSKGNFGFAFGSTVNASISFSVHFGKIGGVDFGTLNISKTGFKGSVHVSLSTSGGFSMSISGGIVFDGSGFSMPAINVHVAPSDLAHIPTLIEKQFEKFGTSIFSPLLKDTSKYAKLVEGGFVKGADAVASGITSAANTVAHTATSAANTVAHTATSATHSVEHEAKKIISWF
ncbi:MAG: hypothetical protein AAFZ15_13435 [Bacteroidota bacterium]